MTGTAGTRVGIVMITRNRRDAALANVHRLLALPGPPPLVVVDNGSTDGTATALRRQPGLQLLALPGNLGAAARTLGVTLLQTPYVAFADDDSWWAPDALALAADLLDTHHRVAVVNGAILAGDPPRMDPMSREMQASPLGRGPHGAARLVSFMAGASVVRREAYLRVGGFEPRLLIGGEEELLSADLLAAGLEIVFAPWILVRHRASVQRDAHGRRYLGIRNALWTTWLRRPAWRAVRRTLELVRVVPADRVSLRAVAAALRGLPWVLAERRALPAAAERQIRLVERGQLSSAARRYVS